MLAVVAAAGALGSVLGRTGEPVVAGEKPWHEREVRRVLAASFHKDESGSVVYLIKGEESWRRTGVEVRRGQKIEVGPDGTRAPILREPIATAGPKTRSTKSCTRPNLRAWEPGRRAFGQRLELWSIFRRV